MPKINFPESIIKLADKYRQQELEKQRVQKQKRQESERNEKRVRAERLKSGLEYAEKIFGWASSFIKSRVGKELMKRSHIPTLNNNVYFFDGFSEKGCALGVFPGGLIFDRGGRYSSLCQEVMRSTEELAVAFDAEILKNVCEWIDNGKVWECIERHFNYRDT